MSKTSEEFLKLFSEVPVSFAEKSTDSLFMIW